MHYNPSHTPADAAPFTPPSTRSKFSLMANTSAASSAVRFLVAKSMEAVGRSDTKPSMDRVAIAEA